MNRKSQITVFIIIAIVIVAGVAGYFLLRGKIGIGGVPAKFQPIETYFLDCISEKAEQGKEILGERGGWINLPDFEAGSSFAPSSSQLNFFGNAVPYWYYISGNGIVKEQVPSKQKIEQQLADYLESEIQKCSFESFEEQGFVITAGKPKASVVISDFSIDIEIQETLNMEKDNEKASRTVHEISLTSKFGMMYNEALNIYNNEKQNAFLESYGVDVMRLYAPVDGVEISCAPKIWMPEKVVGELKDALEANVQAIKIKGNYYKETSDNKYFVVSDVETGNSVNFIYNKNWPSRFEVWPVEDGLMSAEPVGNQEGLGILGFCYVPYHFVYDMMYPVLIQVYDSKEIFQFPVSVFIDKNKPRAAVGGDAVSQEVELCKYKNTDFVVHAYDSKLNGIEAEIRFKCFDTECDIGITEKSGDDAVLYGKFPQCVNGFVIAKAPGYAEKKQMVSTNEAGVVDIVLDRLYNVSVNIEIGGKEAQSAVVYFRGKEHSTSMAWPEQKQIQLTEGEYNISVYSYANSSVIFPATNTRKCIETVKPGILGIFGGKSEQCFDINMPSQTATSVLNGGGKNSDYFTEDRLENGKIKISGEILSAPTSLEELQKNYELFETKKVYILDEQDEK